jgi:ABC-type histidine transport system ATPase subunit
MATPETGQPTTANAGESILELREIHTFYGSIEALKGISIAKGRS